LFVDYRRVTRAVCAAALTILGSRPAIGHPAPEQDTSGLLRRLSLDDAVALAVLNDTWDKSHSLNQRPPWFGGRYTDLISLSYPFGRSSADASLARAASVRAFS
jgi:hypothetical protein